ncbi:hypothetical protein FJZ17_02705 [Candidatus Pacearchaeota archaeon]|nr:hypothetical protein [Candidatus Pacearchaeota archaeon]
MKKGVSLVFLFFTLTLVLTSLVSAVTMDLKKTSLYPGETLQVEVTGNFLTTLSKDNFKIYLGDAVHSSPIESGLIKSEGKYLFYALVPNTIGAYRLRIEDATYTENSIQKTAPIVKNFSIVASNSSYLSFNPGYVYATRDIPLVLKAYNADQIIDVELLANGYKTTARVFEDQTSSIVIPISGIQGVVKTTLKVGSYSIPATIVGNSTQTPEKINSTRDLEDLLEIEPEEFELTILSGYENSFEFEIRNIYGESVDLELNASDKEINLSITEINSFSNKKVVEFTINSKRNFDGFIEIFNTNSSIKIPILVKITQNKSQVNYSSAPVNVDKSCKDLGGVSSCADNEYCERETTASDGYCCLSKCKVKESSNGWIWGLVLIIILGVGIWYYYTKYKQPSQGSSSVDSRVEKYKARMSPGVEVTGNLGKE